MKSKKRHHSTSEDSEDSDLSAKSNSSSGSESDDTSASEHRHRKKRKHVNSSETGSESEDQKRSKKRKHKKKKKKHGKKKRRSGSGQESNSPDEVSSVSEGEISKKKRKHKHKHKHSKRTQSFSISGGEEHVEPRLHSVVRERRESVEDNPPSRTYYQKVYHRSISGDEYEREREVERFYRGSSKDRRHEYSERYQYDRERNNRYILYQEKCDRNKEKLDMLTRYNYSTDYVRRQRECDGFQRQRYENHKSVEEEYHRRQREEFHLKEDTRGYTRHNQYEERGPRRREFEDNRDYRGRHGPSQHERYGEREYPDRRERYRDEGYPERPREPQRDKPGRSEKPMALHYRERSRSRSPERYRERDRRPDNREERNARYRDDRDEDKRERRDRSEERRDEREKPAVKSEPRDSKPRERKSRFTDSNENKEYAWGKTETKEGDKSQGEKEKPNFGLSGKLTADANTVNGVVIKYAEPDDAKQPKRRWRFYPFKGDKALPILYIHRQSCFLLGRDKKVVDIQLEHPSVSKQHAALQFRATPFTRADGSQGRRVRPYIIDLDSANGTFVNNKKVDPRRYVELLERDVVKFGFSQREYVLLHENSKDDAQDDDHEPTTSVVTVERVKNEKREQQARADDGV